MTNANPSAIEKNKVESKWLVMAAVMLGTFMAPLDASIVNTVLPDITGYFRTDISIVQWVPTVYLLTISSLILLYGRLGDMIGYKKIFIMGLTGFVLASVLCGSSQTIGMLIGFRAIQGLAAGMIMAVGVAIITSAFPPKERGKAMGIYAISISAALGLGPTLGGLIVEYADTWRYVFFINVPIGIAAVAWGLRTLPSSNKIPGQRLDVAGAFTASVFLLCLLLYANRGEDWGWTSPLQLSLLGIAILFGITFYVIERKSTQPMLELSLFSSRRFSLASFSAMLMFMALYAIVFLAPFYLVYALHYSILKVGLVMAASPMATLVVAPICGILSDRTGTRIFTVSGMCIAAFGLFLMSELNESSDALDVAWRLTVTGSGIGMFQSPNNSRIMGSVSPRYMGIASGVIAAMRNVGMVFGIAVAGAVLYAVAPSAATAHPGDPSFNIQEFVSGLHWAFITGMGLAIFAALTSLAAVDRQGSQTGAAIQPPSTSQAPLGS